MGKRRVHIKPESLSLLRFGEHQVQVGAVEQLVHPGQLRAIGYAIHYASRYINGHRSIKEICELVMTDIRDKELDCLSEEWIRGDLSEFRSFELAATLNRFRELRVRQR